MMYDQNMWRRRLIKEHLGNYGSAEARLLNRVYNTNTDISFSLDLRYGFQGKLCRDQDILNAVRYLMPTGIPPSWALDEAKESDIE